MSSTAGTSSGSSVGAAAGTNNEPNTNGLFKEGGSARFNAAMLVVLDLPDSCLPCRNASFAGSASVCTTIATRSSVGGAAFSATRRAFRLRREYIQAPKTKAAGIADALATSVAIVPVPEPTDGVPATKDANNDGSTAPAATASVPISVPTRSFTLPSAALT
jgi:hypothetical protein